MSPLLNARVASTRQAYATEFGRGCLPWACDVTTIESEGDFTSLGMRYCVWYVRGCQAIISTDGGTKYPAQQVGRVVYRSVNSSGVSVCTPFSHYCYSVYKYTPCFLPTVVEDVVVLYVDVASMSGALVSGARENMP